VSFLARQTVSSLENLLCRDRDREGTLSVVRSIEATI
jgi:hypothetical protein